MNSDKFYPLDICGYKHNLPIISIAENLSIAFFNLHGNVALTEHCAKHICPKISDAEIILTAESKGLQLAHCVARILGHSFYAVARKSLKLYMNNYIEATVKSITTNGQQKLYLSEHDKNLLKGKKVAIIDDVISTGESLKGLVELANKSGGIVHKKAFVLAEGQAKERDDIVFLNSIPFFN